ncbi:hypothetical protein BDZ45DRAFT_800119 [Acephala macrosclerotiorum]|nr:hypothetical protein BDZ45DRAFT_800119 [Acephala macrosclerotiorum]
MAELLEFHSPEICGVVCRRNSEAEAPTIYFHASITHTANLEKCTVRATPAAFAHPERKQYLKKSTKAIPRSRDSALVVWRGESGPSQTRSSSTRHTPENILEIQSHNENKRNGEWQSRGIPVGEGAGFYRSTQARFQTDCEFQDIDESITCWWSIRINSARFGLILGIQGVSWSLKEAFTGTSSHDFHGGPQLGTV